MTVLRLRDNRFGESGLRFVKQNDGCSYYSEKSDELDAQSIAETHREILEKYGGKTIVDLSAHANGAILDLTGSHLEKYRNEKKKPCFFDYHKDADDGFRLDTGNLMGVLCFRDKAKGVSLQVEILSRFDKDRNNHFLNYLLAKALDVAVGCEPVAASSRSVLELLLDVIFVQRLGEAAANGLLRHYRTFRNNDWNFKGCFDLPRHIRENVPLPNGIAYVKREISMDVPVNRLLLHAALVVQRRRPDLFDRNESACDALRTLRTEIADPGDWREVLSNRDCREPIIHPFFRETWEPLRQIARMILEEERWQLFQESTEEEVCGVVFDGSWLWESYLATVLKKVGYRHCVYGDESGAKFESLWNVSTQRGNATMYPDFARKEDDKYIALADAKYKSFLKREDRLQMIAYAFVYEPEVVFLIYPPKDVKCDIDKDNDSDATVDEGTSNQGWFNIRKVSSNNPNKVSNRYLRTISFGDVKARDDWDGFVQVMGGKEDNLIQLLQQCKPPD